MKFNFKFYHFLRKTYYKKLVIAFFLFMLLPVIIVGVISYNVSRNSLLSEVSENNQQKIQQITLTTESTLKHIDNLVLQLIQSIYVQDLLREANNVSYTDINKVLNMINNIENSNTYIQGLYVYKNSNNTIYDSKYGMLDCDDFYDKKSVELMLQKDDILQKNKVLWLNTRNLNNKIYDWNYNIITFIRPVLINAANKGAIIVNIDEEKLLNTLDPIRFKSGSRVFILDSEGIVISNKDGSTVSRKLFDNIKPSVDLDNIKNNEPPFTFEYNDVKYITSLRQSEYNQWIYVYMVPEDEYLKPGNYIKEATFFACLTCILLGIIMTILISGSMYTPVNEIVNKVRENSPNLFSHVNQSDSIKNEFEYIKMSFNEVYSKSKKMEFIVDNNTNLLLKTYYKLLLEPEPDVNNGEIAEKFKCLGVNIDSGEYIVFIIELPLDWEVLEDRHKYITEDFYKHFRETSRSIVSMRIKNQNVFIVNNDTIKEKDIVEDLSCLNHTIRDKYEVSYTIGVGSVERYSSISISYQKAQKALERKFLEGIYGIYEELNDSDEEWAYKPFIDKIIENIKHSQMQEVRILLNELMTEIKNKRLPFKVILQIYFNIYVRLFLILEDSGDPADGILDPGSVFYENIKNMATIDKLNEYMYTRIMDINCYLCKDKVFKNSEVVEKVVEFVNKNYDQPITLSDTAEKVYITPTYLGILFKEEMGCTFLDYLTRLRIEKSKKLLTGTDLSVSIIGKKVGYDCDQSFIRNFRKLVALTPNQYRIKSSRL